MPRILIACDKFKGTLDSQTVNQALAEGIRQQLPEAELRCLSVADGGQGFLQALAQVLALEYHQVPCQDVLGRQRQAWIGCSADKARCWIESAEALGLPWILPAERNPWLAHSEGLGQLILAATELQAQQLVIGLGGSASCDGALGCLSRLGFELFDDKGKPLPARPESLSKICRLKPSPKRLPPLLLVADVKNPPLGPEGGVQVYSPQKGADPKMVQALEQGMTNWLRVLEDFCGRELATLAGGGAAGCIGLGLAGALGAHLVSGAEYLLEQLHFAEALDWADYLVTGEGALDLSSFSGKITGRLIELAQQAGKGLLLVSGARSDILAPGPLYSLAELDSRAGDSAQLSRRLLIQLGQQLAKNCSWSGL